MPLVLRLQEDDLIATGSATAMPLALRLSSELFQLAGCQLVGSCVPSELHSCHAEDENEVAQVPED